MLNFHLRLIALKNVKRILQRKNIEQIRLLFGKNSFFDFIQGIIVIEN